VAIPAEAVRALALASSFRPCNSEIVLLLWVVAGQDALRCTVGIEFQTQKFLLGRHFG